MITLVRRAIFSVILISLYTPVIIAQQWNEQPIAQTVPGLWGIAMFDTGRGIAVGGANPQFPISISGIVRKLDTGKTWTLVPVTSFGPVLPTSNFTYWSGASAIKGTGTAWVCGDRSFVYKTTDYGATWTGAMNGITPGTTGFFDIYFKNLNEGMVVGGTTTASLAYYTSNGGSTWTNVTPPGVNQRLYAVHCAPAGSFWYVSGANNTFLKFNPSTTLWTPATIPGTFVLIEGLQFLTDDFGIFSGYNTTGSTHVYRTTNGGASFSAFPTEPPAGFAPFYSTMFFFTQNKGWIANAFTPVVYTSDGGNNWTQYTPVPLAGSPLGAITKLDFVNEQNGWASGGALGGSLTGWILKYSAPPPSPDISTTATTADFGTIECETLKEISFTIKNSGTASLNIPSGGVTFSNPDFTYIDPPMPLSIPGGQQLDIKIRWKPNPSFTGPLPGNTRMIIKSNDPLFPDWNVTLTGIRNYSGILITPYSLVFPGVCYGFSSEVTANATPEGNVPPKLINFIFVSGDNDVTLVSPPIGTVIAGPTTFTFRFKPTVPGSKNATYKIIAGNPNCPQEFTLVFSGAMKKNSVVLNPATVNFGEICAGSYKDMTISVTNTGNAEASIAYRELVSGTDAFPNMYPSAFGPIAPQASAQYKVRFAPKINEVGNLSATYRLILGPCPDTVLLTLQGTSVKTNITVSPSNMLVLGPISVGQSIQSTATFINAGSVPITVGNIRLNPTTPSLGLTGIPSFPYKLDPGKNLTATVRYSPTKIESLIASLCLVWTEPCIDSLCLTVVATSAEAPTIATKSALDLGLQQCASPARDSFYVRNTGIGPLNLLSFDIAGADKAHFSVIRPTTPILIAPGDSLPVVVEYNSPVEGSSSADLVINHNDPKVGNKSTVKLTGRRTVTEFAIEGDTLTLFASCIKVGVSRSFVVRNPSPRQLQITEISVIQGATAFRVKAQALPAVIPPAGTLSFEIEFAPQNKGFFEGIIRVVSEPCAYTHIIRVSGEGNRSEVTFTPSPVDFGTVNIGSTTTRTAQIFNSGSEPMTISAFIVIPSGGVLSLVSPPLTPLTLNPGASTSVTLQYQPTTIGSLLGYRLCVAVSSPCPDTICVSMSGLARAEGLAFDRERIDLTLDPCSFTLNMTCDTASLMNFSSSTLTVSSIQIDPPDVFSISPPVPTPFSLNMGGTRLITICASSNFIGTRSAKLIVHNDDPNQPVLELPLTATRDSSSIAVEKTELDFGVLPKCENPKTLSFAVSNTGTIQENIEIYRAPGSPFQITTPTPVIVLPGQTQSVSVSFSPSVFGTFIDTLIIRTARCDFRERITLRGQFPQNPFEVQPSSLVYTNVAVGGSQTKTLSVENKYFTQARITQMVITPAGGFSPVGTFPVTIDSGKSTALPVQFNPTVKGTYTAAACLIFDLPCQDTVCVELRGTATEGALAFFPDRLLFGVFAQCQEATLIDTLVNTGATTITLTSSGLSGPGANAYTVFNPVLADEQLAPGGIRIFRVRFKPDAMPDGVINAMLNVMTTNSAQPQIDLPLQGERITQVMPVISSIDLGMIGLGTQTSRVITLRNSGSATFTYASAIFPPTLTVTPSFPITLSSGDSVQVTITVHPVTPGNQTFICTLLSTIPCTDSTVIQLNAVVVQGVHVTDIDFQIVPNCLQVVKTAILTNALMQAADLKSLTIGGADASYFTIQSPVNLPVSVPAQDSLLIEIAFTPDPSISKTYLAQCTASVVVDGKETVFVFSLKADSRKPALTQTMQLDFGQVQIGTISAPLTGVFRNNLSFPIRISDVSVSDSTISIISTTPPLPSEIGPNEILQVQFTFSPKMKGNFSGIVELVSDSPCDLRESYEIKGKGVDNYLPAMLSIPAFEGKPDERILVPVMLNTNVGGANVVSWAGAIQFNRTMLHPLGVIAQGTKSERMNVAAQYDFQNGLLNLSADGAAVEAGTGPLVFVEFLVLIGDDIHTPLEISPAFDFTSGAARVASRSNGEFRLTGYCLADGRRLVRLLSGFFLHQNYPNPFFQTTSIDFEIDADGYVDLTVYDLMGREAKKLVSDERKAGRYRVTFSADNLLPGVYICILRSGDRIASRRMILSR